MCCVMIFAVRGINEDMFGTALNVTSNISWIKPLKPTSEVKGCFYSIPAIRLGSANVLICYRHTKYNDH